MIIDRRTLSLGACGLFIAPPAAQAETAGLDGDDGVILEMVYDAEGRLVGHSMHRAGTEAALDIVTARPAPR